MPVVMDKYFVIFQTPVQVLILLFRLTERKIGTVISEKWGVDDFDCQWQRREAYVEIHERKSSAPPIYME